MLSDVTRHVLLEDKEVFVLLEHGDWVLYEAIAKLLPAVATDEIEI